MKTRTFTIYKATSPSGKSYIGQTIDFKRRMNAHKSKNSGCTSFCGAIKKYGWDAFTHEILREGLTLEQANQAEEELIRAHGTLHPNGYNLLSGGDSRMPSAETLKRMIASKQNISDETRRRISESKKGVKASKEAKMKISAALKGKVKSAETREKLSIAHAGKTASNESRLKMSAAKRNISPETRAKMSAAAKARVVTPEVTEKRLKALRAAISGREVSAETRSKISKSLMSHPVSDETRKKMSEAPRKRDILPETRVKMTATIRANNAAKKMARENS